MSPAAKEVAEANPSAWCREEQLLCAVVAGRLTARDAARSLTPACMNHVDTGVLKLERAAVESFEYYRDIVKAERHHDKDLLMSTAKDLRKIWDRQ